MAAAKAAVVNCAPHARKGGNTAVVGSYAAGVVLGGLILGPLVVYSDQDDIRDSGEASAVDRCLADLGYTRRNLTPKEIRVLNLTYGARRTVLLDHLVAGGSLEAYSGTGV